MAFHVQPLSRVARTTRSRRFLLTRTISTVYGFSSPVRAPCCAQRRFLSAQGQPISAISEQLSTSSFATGADAYQAYLEALEQAKTAQEYEERTKSLKMFEAWKASEESNAPRATGVKVIKTLAKETRKQHNQSQAKVWTERAQDLLKLAADSFCHPEALVEYANEVMLETPITRERVELAIQYYTRAGEQGVSAGWFNLGHLLWMGVSSSENEILPSDQHSAMEAFENAIKLGDADAMYFVGVQKVSALDENAEISSDYAFLAIKEQAIRGFDIIERAGKEGHGGALYYLALLHLNGLEALDISPCTPAEFVSHLDAAADTEYADALFLRGHCYYNGEHGYCQSYRNALDDFLKAADSGNADAAVSAGAMFHRGYPGIAQNQERAFELYQHAGELGSLDGWKNVVACYASGEGVPKSLEMAKYITNTVLKNARDENRPSPGE